MNKKRIVVTGGAGFIGSHLCEKLLEQGNDVVCVDNLFTGRKDNIRHLMDDPKQRKPIIDIAEQELGWKPSVKLEDGLVSTVGYFHSLGIEGI